MRWQREPAAVRRIKVKFGALRKSERHNHEPVVIVMFRKPASRQQGFLKSRAGREGYCPFRDPVSFSLLAGYTPDIDFSL
jgi:hypothetical protein